MSNLLWVCLGGAVGSGARYLATVYCLELLGPGFPYGTLAVNLLGSFLIAVLTVVGLETSALSPTLRLALTTGVMGGLTTYSTFSYETLQYLQAGAWGTALANVAATLFGCLAACLLGYALGRAIAAM